MKKVVLGSLLIALVSSTGAFAQSGAATGAATGAVGGAIVGGPAGLQLVLLSAQWRAASRTRPVRAFAPMYRARSRLVSL